MSNSQQPDSKPVQRLFDLKGSSFIMHSRIESEFGFLALITTIDLYPRESGEDLPRLDISQTPIMGRPDDFPLEFRLGEMYYFLQIVPLFNPQNRTDYGLPSSSSLSQDLP